MNPEIEPRVREQIEKAVAVLKEGGIVAYPTDTVYGLGASVTSLPAIEQVFSVKARPRSMPLPLLLADVSQIQEFATEVPPAARALIRAFLPGALTLVLPAAATVPNIVTAGQSTVALRIPAHPVTLALIKGLGTAITGTSANSSGQPSPLTAQEVEEQLGQGIDYIIDGGRCPGGKESTIVDVSTGKPVILRAGAIPPEKIREICPELELER